MRILRVNYNEKNDKHKKIIEDYFQHAKREYSKSAKVDEQNKKITIKEMDTEIIFQTKKKKDKKLKPLAELEINVLHATDIRVIESFIIKYLKTYVNDIWIIEYTGSSELYEAKLISNFEAARKIMISDEWFKTKEAAMYGIYTFLRENVKQLKKYAPNTEWYADTIKHQEEFCDKLIKELPIKYKMKELKLKRGEGNKDNNS